jgi:ABC-2 type transport system permease protein
LSAERAPAHLESLRSGYLLYRADRPWPVVLSAVVPRLVLQGVFYALLGRLLGGAAGARFAFTGAVAYSATGTTVIGVCDIPALDHWSDTYHRLLTAAIRPGTVYLYRALPYAVDGMAAMVIVLGVDGPLLGLGGTVPNLVGVLPLLWLTALTSTMFGLAVAALAARSGQDVLLGNLASYILLAACGVVAPLSARLHWIRPLGEFLPMTHGLAAVHAALAGADWAGDAGLEAAVGAAWLAIALVLFRAGERAARG